MREITEWAFEACGAPLENVIAFKYLGQVMTEGDDDWPAVVEDLRKARKSWGRLSQILIREGAGSKVLGNIFKAATQAVFLFRAKIWILNPRMEQA